MTTTLTKLSPDDVDNIIQIIIDLLTNPNRKLVFLCGAGISISVGLPGIETLFQKVVETSNISGKSEKASSKKITKKSSSSKNLSELITLLSHINNPELNIEDLINYVRDLQKIKRINPKSLANEIQSLDFEEIDKNIGEIIFSTLQPRNENWKSQHSIFCQWIKENYSNRLNNDPPEIFTTNYDELFEKSLDFKNIHYFDGFSGGIKQIFIPESVMAENDDLENYMPRSWIRLWKMHGSINWRMKKDSGIIIRVNEFDKSDDLKCAILPSREKVEDSQLGPFGVFRDRFSKVLKKDETVLVILGYSFRDEHINSLIQQTYSANSHLAILIFDYGNKDRKISNLEFFKSLSNCTVIAPDCILRGGIQYNWSLPSKNLEKLKDIFTEMNDGEKTIRCELGNFSKFTQFISSFNLVNQMKFDEKQEE